MLLSRTQVKLETLKEYVGSATKQKARFKANLRNALDELVTINFLKSYFIEGDIVTVERILPTELPKEDTRGIRRT